MKKFFTRFFIFLLPVIAGFCYVEWRILNIPNNFVLKEKYLEKNKKSIEVLALGSSHILEGINPQYFSHPGFNLANHGQSLYYDIRIASKFLDRLPELKLVIISIDHFSLDYQVYKSELYELDYYYYKYYDILYKDVPVWDVRKYSFIAMHSFGWITREIKTNFKPYDEILIDENGYIRKDSVGHLNVIGDTSGKEKARFYTGLAMCGKRDFIVNDLENFIVLLKSKHINVVILTAPVFHTLSDNIDKRKLSENTETINKLCDKHNLKYFNHFYDTRFTIDDFHDNDHLNYLGAEKLSKIVDSEMIKPLLH